MHFLTGGFKRVSTLAKESGTGTDPQEGIAHEHLYFDDIIINQPGYVYIYLSNENETPVEVFFDDFKVEHVHSPLVQQEDYYPFGLIYNAHQRENTFPNRYLYNDATVDRESATVIFIDGNMSSEAAQHGYDAIMSGVINIGTLDRPGGSARRKKNIAASGLPVIPGKDRDEFLPSVLEPNGRVSVRSITASDNRSAGAQIGAQLTGVKNGTSVIVIPINVPRK